ncbi:PucR family transcriptional regulator [Nocardia sp. NPDC059246]|uniref:PucR family transcriptional regulator n=1 Tax=unclassified Nocardia TaxID=2637762 RepID=UPI00368B7970
MLTVADVLGMPVLRSGGPEVIAGHGGLGRSVRWVHTTELADIAPLLRTGDLVLSTGIALPDTPGQLEGFVASLARRGAAGLIIELGRRWTSIPEALRQACEQHDLTLVQLIRETSFAAVTQTIGEQIVQQQLTELREAERVHNTFTELSIAEAGPAEILDAVQRLSGSAVILEDDQHRVIDFRTGTSDITPILANWQARSRTVDLSDRTAWNAENSWLLTRLGRRDRGWGRLIMQIPAAPAQRTVAIIERAAAALAMHRLHDQNRSSLVRRTHHEILIGLLRDPGNQELRNRCDALGFPMTARQFVGLAVRPVLPLDRTAAPAVSLADEVIRLLVRAANDLLVPLVIATVHRDIRAVLSIGLQDDADSTVDTLVDLVSRQYPIVVGVGRTVTKAQLLDRTLKEAQHVVEAAASSPADPVHRITDVHVRGLISTLGDDERLTLFIDRELGAIKEYDRRFQKQLMESLRAYLRFPNNRSEAAASLNLSRPAFYDRLQKIGRLLSVDLDEPDIRASLHLAIIADEMSGSNFGKSDTIP